MLEQVKKHSRIFELNFRDVDKHHELRMSALVDFMQEVANEHAEILGFDFVNLEGERDYYWIISRAKMQMTRLPKWQERIRIETYPAGTKGLFAMRHFDVFDESEQAIGSIIGYYILMDAKTNRPVRMRHLEGKLSVLEWEYTGEELPKLKAPVTREKVDERIVRSGEIDINEHMNNAHYIRWSTDLFSSEELQNKRITGVQTQYVTALVEGDCAKIVRGVNEQHKTVIQGMSQDEKTTYWMSEIEWVERA